jgi:hypothetical protein
MAEHILGNLDSSPLSQSLRQALSLAEDAGHADTARWCRLELGGYLASNPAMDEKTVVPEYRTVVGQHADIYGRVLLLPANLSFVGETRLRNGVEELEALAKSREVVAIHDPDMCKLIHEHLKVQVYAFRFSSVHLTGVLSSIRMELQDRLRRLDEIGEAGRAPTSSGRDDILELRPNVYSVGVNLRALWRRWKGTK